MVPKNLMPYKAFQRLSKEEQEKYLKKVIAKYGENIKNFYKG